MLRIICYIIKTIRLYIGIWKIASIFPPPYILKKTNAVKFGLFV